MGDLVTRRYGRIGLVSYFVILDLRYMSQFIYLMLALFIYQANNLRVMLLGMVDDPRVVLIKLADRLHNMRTMYGPLNFRIV